MRAGFVLVVGIVAGCGGAGSSSMGDGSTQMPPGVGGNGTGTGTDMAAGANHPITLDGGLTMSSPADMATGRTGGDMAGPVTLQNTSVLSLGNGKFELSFAFLNNRYPNVGVDSLDIVRLNWGGNATSLAVQCAQFPWTADQKLISPLTIDVYYDSASSKTSLYVPCGSTAATVESTGTQAAAPSGSVHVELDGLLSDATRFAATADAVVQ